MMTIQLNRLRLLPTILEYSGDDNTNAALYDKTSNSTQATGNSNKENITHSQQVIMSSRREDKNRIDKEPNQSSAVTTEVNFDTIIHLHRLPGLLLSCIDAKPSLKRANITDSANLKKREFSIKNQPSSVEESKSERSSNMSQTSIITKSSPATPPPRLSLKSKKASSTYDIKRFDFKKILDNTGNLLRSSCKRLVIILIMISFLFIGLWMNFAQFVLYVTLYPVNRRLYQKINYYLIYTILSPVMTIAYYWTNIELNIRVSKSELLKQAKDPMLGLIVLNHTYEMDWLACAVLGDQLDNLGAYKTVSKSEIKYLPIIGWMTAMSQMLFVERDWTKDKLTLGEGLNKLLDYNQTMIGLFCEGTRLTLEKYEASMNYAKARNLKPLRHHLLPRPKGFSYCVQHLMQMKCNKNNQDQPLGYSDQEVPFRIFNAQVMMPTRYTFGSLLRGDKFQADFYVEEVERSRFDTLTEQSEFDQLLYDIYQRKDELVDQYKSNNNNFPDGYKFEYKRKMAPLITCVIGFLLTYSVLIRLAISYSSSMIFWFSLVAMIVSSLTLLSKYDKESRSRYSQSGDKYVKRLKSHISKNSLATSYTENSSSLGDLNLNQSHITGGRAITNNGVSMMQKRVAPTH